MRLTRMSRNLCLLFAATGGALAHGATLLDVYRDARDYDAQYAAARYALEAGREALPQGRAGLLPVIGATANGNRNDITANVSNTPPEKNLNYKSHGWTVSLTQPLFRWDRWATYKQGDVRVAQAEAQFVQARQDLILRATQAYFDAIQAKVVLSAAQANRKAINEQLEEAKKSFEVGTKTVVEVHNAQARYDLAYAQEIVAENELAVKRQQLHLVTGKDYSDIGPLKQGAVLPAPQPASEDKWASSAEQDAPAVQVAATQLQIQDWEISKQRAGHLPSLDLVASKGDSYQASSVTNPGGSTDLRSTVVGLQLSLPLFAGGAVSSAVTQAAALKEKAAADLDNARRSSALLARQSYLGVSAGLAQVKALEAALVSSQSALDSNKLGFEVGVNTNIDVLNALSQYYTTRQSLVKARLDTLTALLKLKSSAGILAEDDVQAVSALFE